MNKIEPKTLKGFRDFLPQESKKRNYVINALQQVFESFGFEALETPTLEYEEILTGKYGDEGDKLMYRFEDNGKRKVALRYDQTVPLARAIAQYQNEITLPFKRYQIQNVWRAENTQKGRYREFLQVDADIVGTYSPLADAEILSLVYKAFLKLGLKINIIINDRKQLNNIDTKYLTTIDKAGKVTDEEIIKELESKGMSIKQAEETFNKVKNLPQPESIISIKRIFEKMGNPQNALHYTPVLVRGLDYYTGLIFEVLLENQDETLSLGGGGRYDNLIGMFTGRDIPAVGFAFGFDRIMEAIEDQNLFPKDLNGKSIFVAFSNPQLQEKAMELTSELRNENLTAEYYLEDTSLEKQLKYADKKGLSFTIIVEENNLILKDMKKRTQETLPLDQIIKNLR